MVKKYYKFIFIFIFGLFLFIPKDTFALTVYAERFNDEKLSMATNDQTYWRVFTSNFNEKWVNLGSGYIRFNFSLQKYSGASTHQVLAPMTASVTNTLGNEFPCDIGTASVNNATHNEQIYSAICPVNFYNNSGLHSVVINFNTNTSSNDYAYYYIWLDGRFSFEVPQFIQDNSQAIINSQSQIIQQQQQTTKAIEDNTKATKELKDTINSDDVNADSKLDDLFSGKIDYTSTPIIGIFRMPITFLQKILNSVNGTCSSFNLGKFEFANYSFVLPCITPSKYLKSNHFDLWTIITGLFNMFMIYNLGVLMLRFYECVTDLKSPLYLLFGRSFDSDDKRNS